MLSDYKWFRGGILYLGEYLHNLDSKYRMIMPSKFRLELGDDFIVTKGYDKCIFVYHLSEWDKLLKKINELPKSDPSIRRFERLFIGGASVITPDTQGRAVLPSNLRQYGLIDKAIVFVGVSNRIEIWAKEQWDEYNDESNYLDDELAIKMAELGI